MQHARNVVFFLWLAVAASFIRNFGLSDGFAALFGSVFLLFLCVILLGITLLYFLLRPWLKCKTAVEPSPNFIKFRRMLRIIPILPAILLFLFSYNTEYGQYVKTYRDINPSRTERVMDAVGSTLNITFFIYAALEMLLFAWLWKKQQEQAVADEPMNKG